MKSINVLRWLITSLGLFSVAYSFFLTFSIAAFAACQVTVICPEGSPLKCSGDNCVSHDNCVSCWDFGEPIPEPQCCGGGSGNH